MRKKTLKILATIVALVCVVIISVTLISKRVENSLTKDQMESIAFLEEKTALTPVQITSVVSFIQTESGFDPSLESPNGSFGLCQWLGSRYENLKEFSEQNGTSINNFTLQLEFIVEELSPESEYYSLSNYGGYTVYDWINSDNVEDSIVIFRSIYAKVMPQKNEVLESQVEFAEKIYSHVVEEITN